MSKARSAEAGRSGLPAWAAAADDGCSSTKFKHSRLPSAMTTLRRVSASCQSFSTTFQKTSPSTATTWSSSRRLSPTATLEEAADDASVGGGASPRSESSSSTALPDPGVARSSKAWSEETALRNRDNSAGSAGGGASMTPTAESGDARSRTGSAPAATA